MILQGISDALIQDLRAVLIAFMFEKARSTSAVDIAMLSATLATTARLGVASTSCMLDRYA